MMRCDVKLIASSYLAFFLNKRLSFVRTIVCKHFWLLWCCFGWLYLWRRSFPRSPLHTPRQTTLYLLVFLCSRWCLSLLSRLFVPVFYIFHESLVVELAHLGVQTRADVTSLSFSLSTAKRFSCCGFV
jgi:hypothetical protein